MPSLEQLAWAAGLFEGEGSFFINTIRKNGKVYRYAAATLNMTDEDVVRRFHAIVGCGKVGNRKALKAHWTATWVWRVNGRVEVKRVYDLFAPWLGARRTAKGLQVIEAGL